MKPVSLFHENAEWEKFTCKENRAFHVVAGMRLMDGQRKGEKVSEQDMGVIIQVRNGKRNIGHAINGEQAKK